jgi:hypothetical protein
MNDYKIGNAYYIKTDKRCRGEIIKDRIIQEGVNGIFVGYVGGKARFFVCCENDFHQCIDMILEFTPEYINEWDLKITPLVEQCMQYEETKQVRIVDSQFCNIVSQAVKSAALNCPEMLYEFGMIPKYKNGDVEFDASLVDFKYEFDANNLLSVGVRVTYKDKYFVVKWEYDEYRKIYFSQYDYADCTILLIEENKFGCLVESVGTSRYPELKPLALEICNSFNEYATGLKELEEPLYMKR